MAWRPTQQAAPHTPHLLAVLHSVLGSHSLLGSHSPREYSSPSLTKVPARCATVNLRPGLDFSNTALGRRPSSFFSPLVAAPAGRVQGRAAQQHVQGVSHASHASQ